jgi:hypothetical protein
MKLKLLRLALTDNSTVGALFVDGVFHSFTLEDAVRATKIAGLTAIPEGCYSIKRRLEKSPKQKEYATKYDWFDYHFELQGIPNYRHVYIHIGNTSKDTDGCILVGESASPDFVGNSKPAFESLYKLLKQAEDKNESIEIEICTA